MGTQLLESFSYLLRKKAKQEEIGKALAVVSNALKKNEMVDFDTSDLSFKLESVTFQITVNSRSPHIVPTKVFIYQILKQCFKCFFLRENKSKL